eukprot:gene33555-43363_t
MRTGGVKNFVRYNSKNTLSTTRRYLSITDNFIPTESNSGDLLISALNGAQDISIRAVSCREVIQESILRSDNNITPQASTALAELMVCSLLMGSTLKGQETLQVNLVGTRGLKNVMAITDGDLQVRGMIGSPRFSVATLSDRVSMQDLLGEGQVQVTRNHPTWKRPQNGIVALRDTSVALNLALYMVESEQRLAAMITDVRIDGNLCRHAMGLLVERLPGATEENVELSIANLAEIEKRVTWIGVYIPKRKAQGFTDTDSLRWEKSPKFKCSCDIERVWRALRLLPLDETKAIVEEGKPVDMKCEFCGQYYSLTPEQIKEKLLS